MRRAITLWGVAAVVLLAAGCGGGGGRLSKSQYEQKLKAEGAELSSAFKGTDLAHPNDLKQLASRIDTLQGKLNKAADDIDALEPPQEAKADNTEIAAALHSFADQFGKLKQAARDGDTQKIQQLQQELGGSQAVKDAQSATNDLVQKGYDIGKLGQ